MLQNKYQIDPICGGTLQDQDQDGSRNLLAPRREGDGEDAIRH